MAIVKGLYGLDQVACVRFASVFNEFQEVEDFAKFLDEMSQWNGETE